MENPFTPVPEFEEVPDVEPVDDELVVVRELLVVEELEDVWPEFVKLDSEDPEFRVCVPDAEAKNRQREHESGSDGKPYHRRILIPTKQLRVSPKRKIRPAGRLFYRTVSAG
ncbi:MAG: hypothetical protein U0936_16835 [Planctomycetaceae bacterium]